MHRNFLCRLHTGLSVCKNKRIKRNRVFKGSTTAKGKSTMGRFYGFKLHLIINDNGEIFNFVLTQANVDHTAPLKDCKFVEKIKGKLYADEGYISKKLTELLFIDRLHLVTSSRNNFRNVLLELKDKILLRKRSGIETVNDELKTGVKLNIQDTSHSQIS
jgi:hypothetical protein